MRVTSLRRAKGGGAAALRPSAALRRLWVRRDWLWAVLVLSPSIVAVAVFIYGFILWTGWISLVRWNDVIPDYTFAGIENYLRLFAERRFLLNMRNLALFSAGLLAQCIVFGFVLAALLDAKVKAEWLFRTVYVLPFAISAIVTGVSWRWLMFERSGFNLLFEKVGLAFLQWKWHAHPTLGILAVSVATAWQLSGYTMALYLAGIRGIPVEIRDAAAIDGASTWQMYRRIIIPMVRPVTWVIVVILTGVAIRLYDIIAVLGSGGAFSRETLGYHMFDASFHANRFSRGAAIGTIMVVLSLLVVVPYLISTRRMEQEG
jgi:glucose/mannose transport system permease protein